MLAAPNTSDIAELSAESVASLLSVQLLANPDFEDELTSWTLQGSCEVTSALASLPAAQGSLILRGGQAPEDCVVNQTFSVDDHPGLRVAIEDAAVAAELTGQVATWYGDSVFEDRALLRVVFRDDNGDELGRTESLVGGEHAWRDRTARAVVPPGTAFIDAEAEIRWARGDSSDAAIDDLSFSLQANSTNPTKMTALPMLQLPELDAITLQWGSDENTSPPHVVFGEAGSPLEHSSEPILTVQVDETHYVHTARLSGLEPGLRYEYQVHMGGDTTSVYDFMSAPSEDEAVRFGVFADNQDAKDNFSDQVWRFSEADVDAVLVAGDIVQRGTESDHWVKQWYEPMSEGDLAQSVPVIYARGNHDEHSPPAMAYTTTPEDAPWFARRFGATFIVVLNTELTRKDFSETTEHPSESSDLWEEQGAFLQEALASDESTSAAWRLVMMHQPPYTAARHDDWSVGKGEVREFWVETFEDYDVDLVIGGHFHSYQRGEQNGVTYLVTGGGGHTLDFIPVDEWDFIEVVEMVHHVVIMDVDSERLSWQAIDIEGTIIDEHSLER